MGPIAARGRHQHHRSGAGTISRSADPRATRIFGAGVSRDPRHDEHEQLDRAGGRFDGGGLAGAEIDAGALVDVVALAVERDPALAVHQVDELVPGVGAGVELVAGVEPAQAGDHVLCTAQRLVEHLGHLAAAGRRPARKLVVSMKVNDMVSSAPSQVCTQTLPSFLFQRRSASEPSRMVVLKRLGACHSK